nr:MAG TPA: hypothetical protein [Caudoviricetes sp.]
MDMIYLISFSNLHGKSIFYIRIKFVNLIDSIE